MKCKKCGVEKEETAFSPKKRGANGRNPVCKACVNAAYREAHPPKDPSTISNKYRNYGIKRTETDHGTTLVQFGDKARHASNHRRPSARGLQSSMRIFEVEG